MLVFIVALISACTNNTKETKTTVEIKENWYYINGEKFFIKGIGYEIGARPGQDPYKDSITDLARMKYDLELIKSKGFNTIRTWSQLSEAQLQVVQQSGLKIIFGIWIDPHGNFGDSIFQKDTRDLVKRVVSYTRNYDCVISYLILNEPLTNHIYQSGATEMGNILSSSKSILNTEHSGIPVSISGSAPNADFIDMTVMDYTAYNNYDYGSYQNGTMGYAGFLKWCNELNKNINPLIITEFGYSVSNQGPGNYGYGGNSLEQQRHGVLKNYRELLDAGATGACPFYYADGWWKGNEPNIHNDVSEEWFGFFGYSDLNDTIGSPRPVWYALSEYMKALIISPKNQDMNSGSVIPLEFFLDAEIETVHLKLKDSLIYSKTVTKEGYCSDSLKYVPKGLEDAELHFEFLNKNGLIVKTEILTILLSEQAIKLPKLTINVNPNTDLDKAKDIKMNISLADMGKFEIVGDLHYNFNFHIGWETGPEGSIAINNNGFSVEKSAPIPDNCYVVTSSAGITVKYGKYKARLHDQKMIFRGSWADEISVKTQ